MQKYKHGDLVRVAKDLGSMMRHFKADCDAIVIGSYADKYNGSNTSSYTLHFKGSGRSSWYNEHQLTLIESGCAGLLDEWKSEEEAERKQASEIDWIFENGPVVLKSAHGASISTLARCFGLIDLWGPHGEGFVYYQNAHMTLGLARKYLENKDKEGWLELCDALTKRDTK